MRSPLKAVVVAADERWTRFRATVAEGGTEADAVGAFKDEKEEEEESVV